MAVRLPVVLSQSGSRSPKLNTIEEDWITHLLFESRLDATLIEDLLSVKADSTDQLCLEGIKGDFVLINWLDAKQSYMELSRLGIASSVLVDMLDGSTYRGPDYAESSRSSASDLKPLGPIKKIYHLQLTERSDFASDKVRLQSLLQSLSTPVFQLGIGRTVQSKPISNEASSLLDRDETRSRSRPPVSEGNSPVSIGANTLAGSVAADDAHRRVADADSSQITNVMPAAKKVPKASHQMQLEAEDSEFEGIESLVDELNDLDI